MASLIGKALATAAGQQGPPVPMGASMPQRMPGLGYGPNSEIALMRAYGSNGTVYANVSLLASSVAKPAWNLFRQVAAPGSQSRFTTSDEGSDQRPQVTTHAALNVLNNPASVTVNGVSWQAWTRFRLFEISGLWLDHPEGSTLPLGLWPVRPDRMTPVPDPDRYLKGWVYTAPDGREQIPLLPTEVIFNCYPDPLDVYGGMGPIRSVLTDIESSRAAAEWNRNFFMNSAEPGGVIQVDHEMEDDEWNKLVNRWREDHHGVARAHRIAVLEGGQTYTPNNARQRDMEFTAGREAERDIIREAVGMHKIMTGVSDDVNRANAQTGEEIFASWKVAPRLDRWKDVLNTQLLPLCGPTGQGVEFDYHYPTPVNREQDMAELVAKAGAAMSLVTAGYDQHDVLEMLGLPDMNVALKLSTQPALPPRWTVPLSPGESPPAGDAVAAAEAILRAAAARDPRAMAMFNRLVGSTR
jgi:phage portal protein BeeE